MIIVRVGRSNSNVSNTIDVQLPHANMKVDPRHIDSYRYGYTFRFSVNGRTLTITRTDEDEGWFLAFYLRAYLLTEEIPDFTSTVYTYWGLLHEEAPPPDTTELIIHPSVNTIKNSAFDGCGSLVRVTIPDHVTRIEDDAFYGCHSLRYIQLPRNLEFIGERAFYNCKSLHAVFLPPAVTHIGDWAFLNCKSLTFFYVPEGIEHIGIDVVLRCDRLLTTVNYRFVDGAVEDEADAINNDEVNEWLTQRYANLPFHQACSSISVTPQVILHGIERATEVDNQQMTALHILCANPHVTRDAICAYLQLAPEAADQEDSEGMTPFLYLCRNDIAFLEEDRSFSSLMIWWYHCMPPQMETGKKRKLG